MVHVAANRHVSEQPKPEPMELAVHKSTDEFVANHQAWREWFAGAHLVPINGPHDGCDYCEETAADAADRLEQLRAAGYVVPQCAIDALRTEANES